MVKQRLPAVKHIVKPVHFNLRKFDGFHPQKPFFLFQIFVNGALLKGRIRRVETPAVPLSIPKPKAKPANIISPAVHTPLAIFGHPQERFRQCFLIIITDIIQSTSCYHIPPSLFAGADVNINYNGFLIKAISSITTKRRMQIIKSLPILSSVNLTWPPSNPRGIASNLISDIDFIFNTPFIVFNSFYDRHTFLHPDPVCMHQWNHRLSV